ncbi:MAG: ABC transporter ATP-binding protein, partial [Candidatus Thorarchaeota archaeon]|nr:ABC transporter ATP-binding protein [Candidatus Thorarchaeota archaeon]
MGFQIALAFYAVIAFVVMYSINSEVTLFVFVPFTLVTLVVALARNKITKYRKSRRKAAGKVTGVIGEVFGNIQAVKVASAEKHVLGHFERINDGRKRDAVKDETLTALIGSVGEGFARVLGIGIMLLLVGSLMQTGQFSVGDFAFFTVLLERVIWFVMMWGRLVPHYQRTKVSFERMIKIVKGLDPDYPENKLLQHAPIYLKEDFPTIPPILRTPEDRLQKLEAKNLAFHYPDSRKGIQDANLEIKRGSFTVVTGRVGSGKTTLLRTLLGLLPSNKGTILWNDVVVEDAQRFFVPPRTAYTSQAPHLYSDTIRANILMGLPEESVDIHEAMRLSVVEQEVNEFEKGLDSRIGPKGVKVSGG